MNAEKATTIATAGGRKKKRERESARGWKREGDEGREGG